MPVFANLVSETLMTLGIAVISFVLLLRIYRRARKTRKEDDNWRTALKRQETRASEQVALWEAEIEEKLRRIEARLDNKIAAIEYLVAEAQAVIQELEELVEEQRRGR